MAVEKSAWFDDLKHGTMFQRLQTFGQCLRFLIQLLALELMVISGLVLAAVYVLKHQAGYFLRNIMLSWDRSQEVDTVWNAAWNLKSLNIDGCLSGVFESLYNGFTIIFLSGFMCLILGIWRSISVDFTCMVFLLIAVAVQSREMKRFDNMNTPLQKEAIVKMRKAVRNNQLGFQMDFLSAADFLMYTGNCCGVMSGAEMEFLVYHKEGNLRDGQPTTDKKISKTRMKNMAPLLSPCWWAPGANNKTGCYVHYFETNVKPAVRSMYGLAMLTQVTAFALIILQSEIPPSKQEALKILFSKRLPTPFPID